MTAAAMVVGMIPEVLEKLLDAGLEPRLSDHSDL
jgi:hypothetical protein